MLAVIDGNHLLHRVVHTNSNALTTSKGEPVGGVYQALRSLQWVLGRHPAHRAIMVWDGGHSIRRKAMQPGYKDRASTDEDIRAQFVSQRDLLIDLLPNMGVRQIMLPGKEADDIIGRLALWSEAPILVLSGDKDFLQLIDVSKLVQVYRPGRAGKDSELITYDNFRELRGFHPSLFLFWLALTGDSVDGIPGIKGVGKKTIADLLPLVEKLWLARPPQDLNCYGPRLRFPWKTLLQDLVAVCESLIAQGRARSRHQAILDNLERIQRNVLLIDLTSEDFTPEQESVIYETMAGPANGIVFNEMGTLTAFRRYEFASLTEHWSQWTEPFRRLR